jgi:hypothetical protein
MYEPTAAARQGARALYDHFAALTREGFTEPQALHIIGVMLASAIHNNGSGQA